MQRGRDLSVELLDLLDQRLDRRDQRRTSDRRVPSSTSPTRPSGARLSFASGSAGFLAPE